jgi:excisionase family DNA binding protein
MPDNQKLEEMLSEGLDRIPEVSRYLKVSRSQVYALMERGVLPYVRIGRSRRVPHRAVVDLVMRNLVLPTCGADL